MPKTNGNKDGLTARQLAKKEKEREKREKKKEFEKMKKKEILECKDKEERSRLRFNARIRRYYAKRKRLGTLPKRKKTPEQLERMEERKIAHLRKIWRLSKRRYRKRVARKRMAEHYREMKRQEAIIMREIAKEAWRLEKEREIKEWKSRERRKRNHRIYQREQYRKKKKLAIRLALANERERERLERNRAYWCVAISVNNRMKCSIGYYHDKEDAFEAFDKAIKENKKVKFQKLHGKDGKPRKVECLLIKRKGDLDIPIRLRDANGEFVEHRIEGENGDVWMLWNKSEFKEEQSFKMYKADGPVLGLDITDVENETIAKWKDNSYDMVTVAVNGKFLVCCVGGEIDTVVTMECESDAWRLYRHLYERMEKKRITNIIFIGGGRNGSAQEFMKASRKAKTKNK